MATYTVYATTSYVWDENKNKTLVQKLVITVLLVVLLQGRAQNARCRLVAVVSGTLEVEGVISKALLAK